MWMTAKAIKELVAKATEKGKTIDQLCQGIEANAYIIAGKRVNLRNVVKEWYVQNPEDTESTDEFLDSL